MGGYWRVVEPVWEEIDICSGPDAFRQTFDSSPRPSALLFAAHFCQSEICNGGFQQFFWNSTGVLAPEAAAGFHEIGMQSLAEVVKSAMNLLGTPYPRERVARQERLHPISKESLGALDDEFYRLLASEAGGFELAADRYAAGVEGR